MNPNELEAPPVLPERPRTPLAWVLLVGFILLTISFQLFTPSKRTEGGVDAMQLESQFKLAVLADEFTGTAKAKPSPAQKKDLEKGMRTVHDEALKGVKTDPLAATLVLASGKELGIEPEPQALQTLQTSNKPFYQRIARIYGEPPPTVAWVAENRAKLPKNFLGKVLAKHALQRSGQKASTEGFKADAFLMGFVFIAGLLVLAVGVMSLLYVLITYFSGGIKPVGHPLEGLSKADADRLALRMCAFFLLMSILPLFLRYLVVGLNWAVQAVLIELGVLGAFLLVLKTPLNGVADSFRKLVGQTRSWPKLAAIGALAFAANLPIVMMLALLVSRLLPGLPEPTHPLAERMTMGADGLTLTFILLTASVMAPILEELSFRGLLFPSLTAFMNPFLAMAVTGFAFASIHPQGPALWAALGMVGAVAAGLTYFTGSLIPAMTMHACHNTAILILGWVMQY